MMVHFPTPRTENPIPIDKFQELIERSFPGSDLIWEAEDNGIPGHYVIGTKLTIVARDEELFVEPYDAEVEVSDNVIDLLSHPKFLAAHHHEITETID